MKVKFYGAAQEVGRSCIQIQSENVKILLDAGVKIGETDEYPVIEDSELKSIDAIVLSHAHLDHVGYLAHIFSTGWDGYVYATKPTFELTSVLIRDYINISNPKNVTKEGFVKLQKHFKLVEYGEEFKVKKLKVKLNPAGHILGSATVHVNDGKNSVLYTGDINLSTTRLLKGAYLDNMHADTLITESTYGGDADIAPSERTVTTQLIASIKDTLKQGGKVIIPSFAVGRSQEVLFRLNDSMRSGLIPKTKIYVDGMINRAMRIHRHNVIYCREELQKRILMSEEDPFKSENFFEVSRKDRRKVTNSSESSIIVTTSGMLTGGPVLYYLSRLAGDPKNKLIMVGYQAEDTRGREILEGAKSVEIDKKKVDIKLKVEKYSLSAHADRRQLESIPSKIKGLKRIFVVHGDEEKMPQFAKALSKKHKVIMPKLQEEFSF